MCNNHLKNPVDVENAPFWMNKRPKDGKFYQPTYVENVANTCTHGIFILPCCWMSLVLYNSSTSSNQSATAILYGGKLIMSCPSIVSNFCLIYCNQLAPLIVFVTLWSIAPLSCTSRRTGPVIHLGAFHSRAQNFRGHTKWQDFSTSIIFFKIPTKLTRKLARAKRKKFWFGAQTKIKRKSPQSFINWMHRNENCFLWSRCVRKLRDAVSEFASRSNARSNLRPRFSLPLPLINFLTR